MMLNEQVESLSDQRGGWVDHIEVFGERGKP